MGKKGSVSDLQWSQLHQMAARGDFTGAMAQNIIDKSVNWRLRLTVNYDDPRWQSLDRHAYANIRSGATVDCYPVPCTGRAEVEFDIKQFAHRPTVKQVMAWQNKDGYRAPDRAEVETYLDANSPWTKEYTIVGICGRDATVEGRPSVWYIDGHVFGRYLNAYTVDQFWNQESRFLRVREAAS